MILVAGSANLDFVVRVSKIASPGETVLGRDLTFFPGGKGANQAIACARAGGAATEMLLALGDDWFSDPIESSLSKADVQMHQVRVPGERTGVAFISVGDDAENAITVAPGANNSLAAGDLPPIAGYSYLLLQLETPVAVVTEFARAAKQQNVKVVLNAAPAQKLPQELMAVVDILVVNELELDAVAGHDGEIRGCLEQIEVPCVIVTLGDRGCCAIVDENIVVEPGFAVKAVDTTAAGDTFCGVLVATLNQDKSLQHALKRANAAGALACTRFGAQASIPECAEVDSFLNGRPSPATTEIRELRRYCGLVE